MVRRIRLLAVPPNSLLLTGKLNSNKRTMRLSAQLNQLAFSFAIPANVIRSAIENSMGEARVLCEQWGITWEFIELRAP